MWLYIISSRRIQLCIHDGDKVRFLEGVPSYVINLQYVLLVDVVVVT